MKNKNVPILEFCFWWPVSVEFISKTVRDRGNTLTYDGKLLAQSIQEQNWLKIQWKIKILYTFQIWKISELVSLIDPFQKKRSNF